MVKRIDIVAIDSTFIFKRSHTTFLGANLIVKDGYDHTLTYGVIRSLLRLIKKLGRCNIVVLLTTETFNTTDRGKIENISSILEAIGIPVYSRPGEDLVTICHCILPCVRSLVSESMAPLQFICDDFFVIQPRSDYDAPIIIDCDSIREEYGVEPSHMPTYLSLTSGPRYTRFTERQTQRLIQSYGSLDEIYRNLKDNDALSTRLHASRQEIFKRYRYYHAAPVEYGFREKQELVTGTPAIDRSHTTSILKEYGCHSLARLL